MVSVSGRRAAGGPRGSERQRQVSRPVKARPVKVKTSGLEWLVG